MTGPLAFSILLNLYINVKFGSDSYLKKFQKNYVRFKQIFLIQRIYFFFWTITMIPAFFLAFGKEEYMIQSKIHIYAISLAVQPLGIIATFSYSWY